MSRKSKSLRLLGNATNAELAIHYRFFMNNDTCGGPTTLTFGDVLDEVFHREILLNQLEEM